MSFQLPFESTRISNNSKIMKNFEGDQKEERSKLSVQHRRSFARRTCTSKMEFNVGKCSKIRAFPGRTDRWLPLPCQTGKQEHGPTDFFRIMQKRVGS